MADLERLVRELLNGRRAGSGWKCKCPAHEDAEPSLLIYPNDSAKGFFAVCKAGCSWAELSKAFKAVGFTQPVEKPRKIENGVLTDIYPYDMVDGSLAFEKLRYQISPERKTFRMRRPGDKGFHTQQVIENLAKDGFEPPLFLAPNLARGLVADYTVLLCEGEKDVLNVERAALEGYVATTNFEGGTGWRECYSRTLEGADVVIFEDNDAKGKERTTMLRAALARSVKRLRVVAFPELKAKGDVSDYLRNHSGAELLARIKGAKELELSAKTWTRPTRDKAIYEDYIGFVQALPEIVDMRRCLLSDELMALRRDRRWVYVKNLEDYIKGHARKHGNFFVLDAFRHYLESHRFDDQKPRLRVDIPAWDGVDRIKQIADVVRLRKDAGVSANCFYELLLGWGATIFRRAKHPGIRPRTLVIQGPQEAGKDTLVDALCGGLGDYLKELNIRDTTGKEANSQLHTALVFRIPEFDRSAKVDIAALKDLLSKANATGRLSYDARDENRPVRCSFIATCNKKDILVDETGNTRYWVFETEYLGIQIVQSGDGVPVGNGIVEQSYPGMYCRQNCEEERMQILGQFRQLAEQHYKPSDAALKEMAAYIAKATPRSADDMLLEEFDQALSAINMRAVAERLDHDRQPLYALYRISDVLGGIQRNYGRTRQSVLKLLGRSGRRVRATGGTTLYKPLPVFSTLPDDQVVDEWDLPGANV